MTALLALMLTPWLAGAGCADEPELRFETVRLEQGGPPATLRLAYRPGVVERHPAILMLGTLEPDRLPEWGVDLVAEGFMLVAFQVAHPPDPDPARRAQWLVFDRRFAHAYAEGGARAIEDSRRVVDALVARGDVDPARIGWIGSSSTGIPGLAVATQGPRLAAVVAFVSTGAYAQWFETWRTHGLWRDGEAPLWPETLALLERHDPIRHAARLYPTAVLMVSGGEDQVVDPATARAFAAAARPAYATDPDRLRLVVYEGFGHNLPPDVVKLHVEHWFRLYMHPTRPAPAPAVGPGSLPESAERTRINAAPQRSATGAEPAAPGSPPPGAEPTRPPEP